MGEFELIERVRARLAEAGVGSGDRLALGSGDDAAVITGAGASAVSVDAVVDGIHFRRESAPLAAVGRKALASALSDLAAMGAGAGEALVALGLPADFDERSGAELLEGLVEGAREWSVALAGGDVVAAPVLFVSVTVLGPLDAASAAVRRDGAAPGQLVAVTGKLGGAAAGQLLLERPELGEGIGEATAAALRARQLEPSPRLAAGRALAGAGAAAMIDLSDGLAGDARHVAAASGARLIVGLERLPLDAGVAEVAAAAGRDPLELAVSGGEDYELLACLPAEALDGAAAAVAGAGTTLTVIGEVTAGDGVELRGAGGEALESRGFDQLAGR
ncbi:MAG TPA: thiamine-phosphate kinase [Solirubrobacterales bacterium]